MKAATLTVRQFADLLGVSDWALREAVKRGEAPVPPLHVGRRIVFPRQQVEQLLGPLDEEALGETGSCPVRRESL